MENIEKMEGEKTAESIERRISGAEDIEELENILKEIGEIKGTPHRTEEGGRVQEKAKIYSSEELIKRIDAVRESIFSSPDELQDISLLERITSSEGLREKVAKLLIESSNNWGEFNHWMWLVVSDNRLGKDLQELPYYYNLVEQAKDGVKTIIDAQGQPRPIELAIPRKYGLRPKFVELMKQQMKKAA